jgi:hypothetical protein
MQRAMTRYGIVAAWLAGAVLLAGCGAGGRATRVDADLGRATPAQTPDTKRLVCAESIDLARPGADGLQVVLGVVALPTSPQHGALQTARTGMHGRLRLFAKTGLIIKPRTRFELVVPAGLRRRMALSWGNAGEGAPKGRLTVEDCGRGETTGSRWLVYAGGYYVAHPACVSLLVVAGGQRRRVRIGLGAPCRGQAPPPQPTQT